MSSPSLPTVLQFGAGNIGRGFMGHIFTAAGYEVVFVDVSPDLVDALNRHREYPLRLAGPDRFETLQIQPVRAVDGRDVDAVARELERCDFACTAVGVPALRHIAPVLAAGVRQRERPLDVILCENQLHCSQLLRGLLEPHLSPEELARVGLVESVVGRMVPVVSEADRQTDPLLVVAEDYPNLPVDQAGFLQPPPRVPALRVVGNFSAYVERKLYIHNMGHAVAAYLGFQRGFTYVHEAVADPEIEAAVGDAMAETCLALHRKHGIDREDLEAERRTLLRRFRNPALNDTLLRVGRDPIRKLRVDDRLVGAALTCLDWDVEPAQIVRGIGAAFHFDPEGDPAAQEVQQTLREHGVEAAVLRYCGQRPDGELGRRIVKELG